MTIDDALLTRLAKLGGIAIADDKLAEMKGSLSEIVSFVEGINGLDLDAIPASFNPLSSTLPMREDIIEANPEIAQEVLKHAPNVEDNFFIVPKIIE